MGLQAEQIGYLYSGKSVESLPYDIWALTGAILSLLHLHPIHGVPYWAFDRQVWRKAVRGGPLSMEGKKRVTRVAAWCWAAVRRTGMLMSSVMVGGTAVVTFGGFRRQFGIMLAGRVAAGFGESLLVAMQAIMVPCVLPLYPSLSDMLSHTTTQCQNFVESWWLNMAFSMSNVWGQLGNALVFMLLPVLASSGGLTLAISSCFL